MTTTNQDPAVRARLTKAGIPKAMVDDPIDRLAAHKGWIGTAYQVDAALTSGGLAMVLGKPWTGKSTMTAVILRTKVIRGHTGFYSTLQQFVQDFTDRDRMREEFDERYVIPAYLVLDNCHQWERKPAHNAWVENLIEQRLNANQATLLAMTGESKNLQEHIPPGVLNKLQFKKAFFHCNWTPYTPP